MWDEKNGINFEHATCSVAFLAHFFHLCRRRSRSFTASVMDRKMADGFHTGQSRSGKMREGEREKSKTKNKNSPRQSQFSSDHQYVSKDHGPGLSFRTQGNPLVGEKSTMRINPIQWTVQNLILNTPKEGERGMYRECHHNNTKNRLAITPYTPTTAHTNHSQGKLQGCFFSPLSFSPSLRFLSLFFSAPHRKWKP